MRQINEQEALLVNGGGLVAGGVLAAVSGIGLLISIPTIVIGAIAGVPTLGLGFVAMTAGIVGTALSGVGMLGGVLMMIFSGKDEPSTSEKE